MSAKSANEIEITSEMIEAGRCAAGGELVWVTEVSPFFSEEKLVVAIFRAMMAASPKVDWSQVPYRALSLYQD